MNKTVLIIDTDKTMMDLMKSTLEFQDFSVIAITDPAKAKKTIKSEAVDIVIADIMISNVDMIKFAKAIRKKCPVIMTGIKDLLSNERRSLFCENIPFLQKPLSPNTLSDKVRELVS